MAELSAAILAQARQNYDYRFELGKQGDQCVIFQFLGKAHIQQVYFS